MVSKNIHPIVKNTTQRIFQYIKKNKNILKEAPCRISILLSNKKDYVHKNKMRLFWYNELPNLGDEISPFIVQKHFGMEISQVRYFERNKILAVGSIINYARNGDIVWGSGAIHPNIQFRELDFVVAAVRGPKTRKILLSKGVDCPEIYGDPASLISDIYPSTSLLSRPYRLGIIPHYVDKKFFRNWNDPSVIILDIQSSREKFFADLWQCQRVVSSSLHGIIFAESYGIPAHWMVLSNEVFGGEFKFQDYYLGTDRDPPQPLGINDIKSEYDWRSPRFDNETLLRAFPIDKILQGSS